THCIAEENYSRIFTVDGREILVSKNLGLLQELMPEKLFYRIHKSHLVNLNYVKAYSRFQRHYITLEDGTELDVAKRRIEDFVQTISTLNNSSKE
ncbi:MAG: LytTR family transcriptional regulator, partial [Bacteroidales bacterium]|nr:LytTR family transcriptional regulator [Bacteroidales bacterium]